MKEHRTREIPDYLLPRYSWSSAVDLINEMAIRDPRIGAPITELMEGPDVHVGIDMALSNNSQAILTQTEYQGQLGGGTPKRALEVNTIPKHKK